MFQSRLLRIVPLLLAAACVDDPTATPRAPEPKPAPRVLGVYEITLTGIGTSEMRSSVSAVPSGPGQSLNPLSAGTISLELMSSSWITHGIRGQGGQRYLAFTYRVRNRSAASVSNMTFVAITTAQTVAGTPFLSLLRPDGTAADTAIASQIVPAGPVTITDEGTLASTRTDVLQVFDESEVAAIPLPAGATGVFPYGFVARNPATPNSRTLPVAANANDFGGSVTLAFRYPLQSSSSADPYTMSVMLLAVEDTDTRVTESIEEGQDSSAVRQVRERAAALSATTVTVLAGSPAADDAVADYPGQRQICSVRTAGTAGSPTTFITAPAAYALIRVYRPGETLSTCGAYYRTGTAARGALGMPYNLTLRAMDLYGNVKTAQVDTVQLQSLAGPPVTLPAPAALISGIRSVDVTYSGYGSSLLRALGRRNRGAASIVVAGITRTWTGNVSTDWGTDGNWAQLSAPGSLDSVHIPALRPLYPVLDSGVAIGGVTVDNGASVDLDVFDLTASENVWAGMTGGITSTSGRLVLAGTSRTVKGRLPRLRVTGIYSLQDDLAASRGVELAGGRLRTSGRMARAGPN